MRKYTIYSVLSLTLLFAWTGNIYAQQWTPVSEPMSVQDVRVMMAADSYLFAGTNGDGVFRSNDGGATWTEINQGLSDNESKIVYALTELDDDIYLGMSGDGIFKSSDNGNTWTDANGNLGVNDKNVTGIASYNGDLFISTGSSGVFRSANKGDTWEAVNDSLASNEKWTRAIVANDNYLFVLTLGGVIRSNDNGDTWEKVNNGISVGNGVYNTLYSANGYLYIGLGGGEGAYISSNDGDNWLPASGGLEGVEDIRAFSSSNGKLYAGSDRDGVFLSEDNGQNWARVNDGLTGNEGAGNVWSLLALEDDLFAGTESWIWFRAFDDITVSNEHIADTSPNRFNLEQNYPNPFNPTTTFAFNLPERASVSIKIYDIVGNQVDVIQFGELTAGSYSKSWNAEGLASGVYLYRIQAGTFTQTRQLTLIK